MSRHRWTVCVAGIESQVLAQLGVEVAFDSAPLGGRDLLARGRGVPPSRGKRRRAVHCRRAGRGRDLSITTLTCAACGNTWHPASGASCPACLARGRGRDKDGKLKPDPRWYDPNAARPSGIQSSTEALIRRRREPKPEKRKYCTRCDVEITVGDYRQFCEPCRVEQTRDRAVARYYRLKAESRCPNCKAPVVSSVLCESCKARLRAKPTTDRELRSMKVAEHGCTRVAVAGRLHLL